MTFPNPGPASQSTGNVAGGPYVAWSGTNAAQVIGPSGTLVNLGGGVGGVALYDGANSITSGTAQFSNANGVTFGFNGQTVTASVVTSYTQTNQTVASGGIAGSGFTTATTAGTAVVGTQNSAGVSLGIPKYITTYAAGAATGISSIADSANTQTVGMLSFANSHGVTFGISTGALTATITGSVNVGNATGISGIADSANTQTVGTLSFSNANGIAWGLATGANTATLTASYSQYQFSNSNNISFGSNGSTVTASFSQSVQTQASGNIGATGFATTTTNGVVIVGTNNTAGFTLAVPPYITTYTPGGATTVSYYEQQPSRGALTFAAGSNSIGQSTVMYMQPFIVGQPISFYRGMLLNSASTISSTLSMSVVVSTTLANSSGSARASTTWTMGLFSRVSTGTNANSSNISMFASATMSSSIGVSISNISATNASTGTATISSVFALGFISNIDSAGGITTGSTTVGGSTSFSATTTASSNFTTGFTASAQHNYVTGARPIDFPLASSLSPGEYWFGLQLASGTASGGGTAAIQNLVVNTVELYGANSVPTQMFRFGTLSNNATTTFPTQFYGSVSSAQTSTTIGSNMFTSNSGVQTWFNLMAQTL